MHSHHLWRARTRVSERAPRRCQDSVSTGHDNEKCAPCKPCLVLPAADGENAKSTCELQYIERPAPSARARSSRRQQPFLVFISSLTRPASIPLCSRTRLGQNRSWSILMDIKLHRGKLATLARPLVSPSNFNLQTRQMPWLAGTSPVSRTTLHHAQISFIQMSLSRSTIGRWLGWSQKVSLSFRKRSLLRSILSRRREAGNIGVRLCHVEGVN